MNDIFRGKRVDNGEWVYGYLFRAWERAYILWGTTNDVPNMIEVDPSTVGRYIGLPDKNDKQIFEGDMVVCKTTGYLFEPCRVQWAQGWLSFVIAGNEGYYRMNSEFEYEVVGNIYDNPNGNEKKSGEEAMAGAVLRHNDVSYTKDQLMRIGRSIAGMYGGECINATIKHAEKVVRFDCIEHGERFYSDVSFDDLAEELADAEAEGY